MQKPHLVTVTTRAVCFFYEGKIMLLGGGGCLHHTLLHTVLASGPNSPMIELFLLQGLKLGKTSKGKPTFTADAKPVIRPPWAGQIN